MELKNTKTEKNLLKAFECERETRDKYVYYANLINEDGYDQITSIFYETADNEKAHAMLWIKTLRKSPLVEDKSLENAIFNKKNDYDIENKVTMQQIMHRETIPSTYDILINSAKDENSESEMYENMSKDAQEDGFDDIAEKFKLIAMIEKQHAQRFLILAKNIQDKKVYNKDTLVEWQCRNCGYTEKSKDAPIVCPVCRYGRKYFQVKNETYK